MVNGHPGRVLRSVRGDRVYVVKGGVDLLEWFDFPANPGYDVEQAKRLLLEADGRFGLMHYMVGCWFDGHCTPEGALRFLERVLEKYKNDVPAMQLADYRWTEQHGSEPVPRKVIQQLVIKLRRMGVGFNYQDGSCPMTNTPSTEPSS